VISSLTFFTIRSLVLAQSRLSQKLREAPVMLGLGAGPHASSRPVVAEHALDVWRAQDGQAGIPGDVRARDVRANFYNRDGIRKETVRVVATTHPGNRSGGLSSFRLFARARARDPERAIWICTVRHS
jgi:hypothetical protein